MDGLKEITLEEYGQLWLNAPIGMGDPPPKSSDEAMLRPGCAVKSKDKDGQWPRYFGKVCSYSEHKVVIVSYQVHAPLYMWEGTPEEYLSLWNCD